MTTRRHYNDNSPSVTIQNSISTTDTSVLLSSATGFPTSFPFSATIDFGTSSAEQVLVTSIVGSTATVTRNSNGQGAYAHPAQATFQHTAVAQDLDEANLHITSATGVHGLNGAVVGTTDTQTLTNKTIVAPIIPGPVTVYAEAAGGKVFIGQDSTQTQTSSMDDQGNQTLKSVTASGDVTASGNASITGTVTAAGVVAHSTGADPQTLWKGENQAGTQTSSIDSNGNIVTSGYVAQQAPGCARVGGNGQSLPSGTNTRYQGASWESQVNTGTTANAGEVKILVAGEYLVGFTCRQTLGGDLSKERGVYVQKTSGGASTRVGSQSVYSIDGTAAHGPVLSCGTQRVQCAVNDVLGAYIYQNSGTTLNVDDVFSEARFSVTYVSA